MQIEGNNFLSDNIAYFVPFPDISLWPINRGIIIIGKMSTFVMSMDIIIIHSSGEWIFFTMYVGWLVG